MRRLLLTIIAGLLAGCATGGGGGAQTGQAARAQDAERRYEADATVLQNQEHGPELCVGAVLDSLPPQCSGPPIANWDWDQVAGEERRAGVIWGSYHVVGTYDGSSFTVTEVTPPRPPATPPAEDPIRPGCPEPAGGWAQPDPGRASEEDLQGTISAARREPDFAAAWIAYLEPMGNNVAEDPGEFVLNLAFTGDLERHQTRARQRWGGRLCVTRMERTYRDLSRVQAELTPPRPLVTELGMQVLSSNVDEYRNRVELTVLIDAERVQEALDRRYGAGLVQVDAALKPVP